MGLNKRLISSEAAAAAPTNTDNFAPVAYTGSGAAQSISSLDFQPDLIWIKERQNTSASAIYDSVRTNQYVLTSSSSGAQYDQGSDSGLNSFNSNGFTVDYPNTGDYYVSRSGQKYIAWCWKGGGNSNTFNINGTGYSTASAAGLSISTGSLLGASVNSDSGFGIYKIDPGNTTNDANTITHQLGGEPELIITKRLFSGGNWYTYTKPTGTSKYLFLNTNAAESGSATTWGVSSTTFSAYTDQALYADDTIIYAFRSVAGYQKVGSYTGDGTTSNSITTGFEPRFLMIKITSSADSWVIFDNARDTSNPRNTNYKPNSSAAEADEAGAQVNFTSTGFTCIGSGAGIGQVNSSGATYIYLAIA